MNHYDDIINLPHWEPKQRKRMSMEARAAQFAPFAALKESEEEDKKDEDEDDRYCKALPDILRRKDRWWRYRP